MSTLAKAFVVINLLLGVAFLAVSCVLFSQQQNWKGEYNAVVEQFKQKGDEYTKKLTEQNVIMVSRQEAISRLEQGLKESEKNVVDERAKKEELARSLETQQSLLGKLETDYKGLVTNLDVARTDLANAQKRLDELEASRSDAEQKKMAAMDQVVKLTEQTADFALAIDNLKVKLDDQDRKIVTQDSIIAEYAERFPGWQPTKSKVTPPAIEARIEGVDEKTGLVMLSVGSEDQVKAGFTFYVYRNKQSSGDASYVGQVEVDKVFPTKSSARINTAMSPLTIQPGDGATTRLGSY